MIGWGRDLTLLRISQKDCGRAMVRRSGVDDVLAPHQYESLFKTAATIEDAELAVEMCSLLAFPGRLGPRNAETLHTCDDYLIRLEDDTIVAYQIPTGLTCDTYCPVCKELAKQAARDADDDDVHWKDKIDQYWSPKSRAGGRKIPVLTDRLRELLDLYTAYYDGRPQMSEQTYRNRLIRLEELCDEVDVNLYPQALRATAVNYWVMLGMRPDLIQWMFGWKYLSTARYYIQKSDIRLRIEMQKCLGMEPEHPYDLKTNPPTLLDLRDRHDLHTVENITPQGYSDPDPEPSTGPDPLEKHAQESLQENHTIDEYLDDGGQSQGQIGPALTNAAGNAVDRIAERGVDLWDEVVGKSFFAPLETTEQRKRVSGSIMIALTLLWGVALVGTTDVVNLTTGTVTMTPGVVFALLLSGYIDLQMFAGLLGIETPGHVDLMPESWQVDPVPDA